VALARLDARGTACSAAGTRSDAALHRAGPGLDSTAKTATVASEPMVTLVMVTKSLGSASLTISSHLRPKAMRVSVSAGRSGREGSVPAAQSRRMPERALGLLLTSGGWWVWASAPIRQHMRPRAATRLKPVADEAGRGYTCGTSRGAVATYACSRAPAQPAPRSTCTASPYTPRPASRGSAERRRGRWLREGRCRGVGWGRWDGLIGYDTPTAGRLRAAPISGSGCGS